MLILPSQYEVDYDDWLPLFEGVREAVKSFAKDNALRAYQKNKFNKWQVGDKLVKDAFCRLAQISACTSMLGAEVLVFDAIAFVYQRGFIYNGLNFHLVPCVVNTVYDQGEEVSLRGILAAQLRALEAGGDHKLVLIDKVKSMLRASWEAAQELMPQDLTSEDLQMKKSLSYGYLRSPYNLLTRKAMRGRRFDG